MNDILVILIDAFWSGIAALGFAVLFNVPPRILIYCVIAGAIGHALRTICMLQLGWGIELSTLIGATFVGFFAKWCAVRFQMPSMIFSISGAIPMVPGTFAFRTMIGILQIAVDSNIALDPTITTVVTSGVKTGLILGALAVGITAPVLLFEKRKPIV